MPPLKVLVRIKWVMDTDDSSALSVASDLAMSLTPHLQPYSSIQRVIRKRRRKDGKRREERSWEKKKGEGRMAEMWPVRWACVATCTNGLPPPERRAKALWTIPGLLGKAFPTLNKLHAPELLMIPGGWCYDFCKIMETNNSSWRHVIIF